MGIKKTLSGVFNDFMVESTRTKWNLIKSEVVAMWQMANSTNLLTGVSN